GGSSAPAAGPSSTSGLDASKASGSISFAHWRAEDKAAFDKIIAAFKAKYAGTDVRQDITPSNDYQSNAMAQIRQGTVGDLFVAFRGAQFIAMTKAGLYTDLTSTNIADSYEKSLITAGQSDGKQYGLPYQLVFNQPITNEDLLSQAGYSTLPGDWNSYLDLCDKLKSKGVVPIAWPGGDVGNAGQLFNCMIMNEAPSDDMCTKIEAGTYKVTDDWFIGMLKKYQQLIPYMQPNATGTAVEPAEQMFASGKAAMLATGSYHIAAVRALKATFPIGMLAPITVSKDKVKYVGIYNATFILGVSTVSKNPNTAFALLKFLSDPAIGGQYGSDTAQNVTVKNAVYTNSNLTHLADWTTKKTLLAPRFQFSNLDIRNAAEGTAIAVIGGKSPEQAAADAQKIIDQQIKK
ncbi:MAG: ABC transporter substrate-binding protein, partial [Propionibacteriaceae bacterium]